MSVGRHLAVPLFCSVLIAFALLTMAGASGDGMEQVHLLSAANTKFALDLYKHDMSSAGKNIFISPLSISVALAMTYLGARGHTKDQMREVLHFTHVEEDHLHLAFSDILAALSKPDQAYKLYIANRLFADKSDSFLDAGRKFYGAGLEPVDFR